jgi:cAMP-dependent protein kinase regulator
MIFKPKPRFDQLDQFLARREYGLALEAISEEIKRRPENFNLLLRQAEILGQAGDREQAIEVYRKLAQHYTDQGFFARAIAVTNKILRLDPSRQDVTRELASLMAAQQVSERSERERLERSVVVAVTPSGRHQVIPEPAPPGRTSSGSATTAAVTSPEVEHKLAATPQRQAELEREASRFFAAFPQSALESLLTSTCVRTFAPAEAIVREGEPGTSLFLIENGTVEVQTLDPKGRRVVLAELGPGEFFGEVAVLTGRPRTATILAKESVTVIEISRENLERIVASHPEVREVLERFYQQRAHATVEAMLSHLRRSHA